MPLKKKKPKKKLVKKKTIKRKVTKKKVLKRRPAKKKAVAVKKPAKYENIIGTVTHYFPHVQAAVIKLKAGLSLGNVVKIKGHTTDFTQTVTSMQIDHIPITKGKKGDEIGLLVDSRARQHDIVCKT